MARSTRMRTGTPSLWPPFESAEADEMLWEERAATEAEILGWALLTERLIREHGSMDAPA